MKPGLTLIATLVAVAAALAFLFADAGPAFAQEQGSSYGYGAGEREGLHEPEYSPFLDAGYPQRVYWGDTHLHTALSTDAGMIGNRLGLEEAYRSRC